MIVLSTHRPTVLYWRFVVIVSKVGTSHTVIARKLIQSQPRVQIYRGPKKVALQRSSAYCKSAHSRIAPCTHYLNPINDNLTKSFWLPYSRQPLGLSSSRHHGAKLFLKSFFDFNICSCGMVEPHHDLLLVGFENFLELTSR